jgi:hypothetical protein
MYSNFCDENHAYYLAHYGVPGMKWRVHRGINRAFDTRPFAGRRRRRHGGETSNPEYSISSETWRLADLRTSRRRADHRTNQANRDYELYVKDRDRNRRKSVAPSKNSWRNDHKSGDRNSDVNRGHHSDAYYEAREARMLMDATKKKEGGGNPHQPRINDQDTRNRYRELLERQSLRRRRGGHR